MYCRRRYAKINVKLLVILILVVVALGVSLVAARQIRRSVLSKAALTAGEAAFEKGDWPAAVKNLRGYLGRNPDDLDILRKYAQALMSTRPLDSRNLVGAISAYRRILQLDPLDTAVAEKLAMLYGSVGIGNFEELVSLAKTRLKYDPNDRKATLWLTEALARLNRNAEAREVLGAFIQRLEALSGKQPEYVRACVQMSGLVAEKSIPPQRTITAAGGASSQPQTDQGTKNPAPSLTPLDWLNRAVAYAPDSAEALVSRAQFHLQAAGARDVNEAKKSAFLALARNDLAAADALDTQAPLVLYALAGAWMLTGDLDRAAAELQAMSNLPTNALVGQFLDISEWKTREYLLGGQLAMRKGAVTEAVALTDKVLASLDEKQHVYRGLVLPSAIQAYVIAGRAADAKRCLDEYLALVQNRQLKAPPARAMAALRALVEAAENRPYAVIDLLEPVVGNDPSNPEVLRLLADAYGRTGQAGRAVKALEQYRRLNPQDRQVARELAQQYARMGDFEKGLAVAKEAESVDPADVGLKLLRISAEISRAIRRGQAAGTADLATPSAELAELRQQHPDRVDIRILQSIIAAFLNRPQEAEQELARAIAECKEPLRAEVQLMRHYVGAGHVDDALSVCRASCQRHPDLAEPWLYLADLQTVKEDPNSARQSLQQGLQTVTDNRAKRALSARLALLELNREDRRPAGINLLKELAKDPQEIQARLLLLGTREIRGDPNTAEKLIGELRQAEGENGLWWRLYQASLWLAAENWAARQQEITNLLQHCIDADPTWPAPVLTLAALYERQGDFKRVEEVCRQGLLGNPSATEIADRLLKFLTGRGRYADAENVLRQIQNPRIVTDWQVRLAIGTGDFSRAIEGLRLKISNDKQDAASRVELARLLYQQTKDAAQALRYLDEAKAINPRSGTLVAVRASILKAESKSAEALRVLDDYVANYDNFDAYWMRAVYLAEGGDLEHAGQDYRKLTTFKGQEAAGYELLGNFLASTGKLDQAVTTVKEALGAHPEELRLRRRLMLLLLARNLPGDKEEALAILKELEKQLPGDSELMLAHAVEKIREGTPQSIAEAKGILENIVKRQPTTVAAYLYLINIAMQERQYQAACDCAIRALESNPNNSMLLLARAGAELALGYAPMAAKLARQVLQQDPNSIEASDAFVQAALQAALSNNDPSILGEARKLTDDAVRRNPANERLLLSRAHFYAGLKEPRGAIPQLEAYCRTKDGSSSVAALLTLADLYRMGGDAAPADKTLSQVEQLDAHNPLVVHARVLWLISQNRLDDLKGISAAYLAAKPQDPDMLLRAASTLAPLNVPEIQKERIKLLEQAASLAAKTQELAMLLRVASTLSSSSSMELQNEAVKLLEQAASLATSDTNVQVALASTLYQTGNVDRAKKIYQELLRQQPKNVQVLNNLAWVLQEHDHDYSAALELADKGMMIARDDIHLLDTRGTILMNMPGRLSDAKKDYERLLQVSSSDDRWQAKTLLQLGRICAKLNDVPQAKQNLQKAVEINKTLNIFTPDERVEIEKILAPPEK